MDLILKAVTYRIELGDSYRATFESKSMAESLKCRVVLFIRELNAMHAFLRSRDRSAGAVHPTAKRYYLDIPLWMCNLHSYSEKERLKKSVLIEELRILKTYLVF
jgi:hypothetical protein